MKYGIIADIHSNEEALRAVLTHLHRLGAEGFLCLGDLVGYGPSPNEVVEIVRLLPRLTAVAGNHDKAALGEEDLADFNPYAREAALWTQKELNSTGKSFLKSLPKRAQTAGALLVHGTPRDPIDEYFLSVEQFWENEPLIPAPLCLVGHSHFPFVIESNVDGIRHRHLKDGDVVSPDAKGKTVINPGAVGQPRDRDPRAACALYDDTANKLAFFRLPYDISKTQEKMKKAGLPDYLIQRLFVGC